MPNNKHIFQLQNSDETIAFAKSLIGSIREFNEVCIFLNGDLGSGKTTFCRGVLEDLKAKPLSIYDTTSEMNTIGVKETIDNKNSTQTNITIEEDNTIDNNNGIQKTLQNHTNTNSTIGDTSNNIIDKTNSIQNHADEPSIFYPSPSYLLCLSYTTNISSQFSKIHHFDPYRLPKGKLHEVMPNLYNDYFTQNSLILFEWPNRLSSDFKRKISFPIINLSFIPIGSNLDTRVVEIVCFNFNQLETKFIKEVENRFNGLKGISHINSKIPHNRYDHHRQEQHGSDRINSILSKLHIGIKSKSQLNKIDDHEPIHNLLNFLKNNHLQIGIESSCDDTAIAIVNISRQQVIAHVIASQFKVHSSFGGVVPLLAATSHELAINKVFEKTCDGLFTWIREEFNLSFQECLDYYNNTCGTSCDKIEKIKKECIDYYNNTCGTSCDKIALTLYFIKHIGVTVGPGLSPCLRVSVNFIQSLKVKYPHIQITPVHHMEAHAFVAGIDIVKGENILYPRGRIEEDLQMTNSIENSPIDEPVDKPNNIEESTNIVETESSENSTEYSTSNEGTKPIDNSNLEYFPAIVLLVSGGHNLICIFYDFSDFIILGSSIDDSVGEAFDKVGRVLGVSQVPAGPIVEQMAKEYESLNPLPITFPTIPKPFGTTRDQTARFGLDFSFAGLKTAIKTLFEKSLKSENICLNGENVKKIATSQDANEISLDDLNFYEDIFNHTTLESTSSIPLTESTSLNNIPPTDPEQANIQNNDNSSRNDILHFIKCHYAHSFQNIAIEHLTDRLTASIDYSHSILNTKIKSIIVAGGVAANSKLRGAIHNIGDVYGLNIVVPPPKLCTDNGVMVAWLSGVTYLAKIKSNMGLVVRPMWPLGPKVNVDETFIKKRIEANKKRKADKRRKYREQDNA